MVEDGEERERRGLEGEKRRGGGGRRKGRRELDLDSNPPSSLLLPLVPSVYSLHLPSYHLHL